MSTQIAQPIYHPRPFQFRTVDSSLNIAIIAATAAVTAVALCVAGIGWFQYMKVCRGSVM